MRVTDAFDARWSVCWISTYTFDPGYFETFLLRRLGEPPLNVTILVDFRKLAATWDRMDPDEGWRLRRANRDYLVRGMDWPGGAFHAKTILLGNAKGGVLLVGSGNVGLGGLDHGREVFSRFDWSADEDQSAFGTWRNWMGAIIARLDDPQVRGRWADLLERLAWLPVEPEPGPFVTNQDRPLLDQFVDTVTVPVDELIASAPFFDHDLRALRATVERLRPARIRILVGDDVSVDGRGLRTFLEATGVTWEVSRFQPADYVHAKLLGAGRSGRVRVLAGSANLSGGALLQAANGGHGNVEAGVIVDAPAERAAGWFIPGIGTEPLEIEEIERLDLRPSSPEVGYSIRLRAAHLALDNHIALETDQEATADLVLTDGIQRWPIAGSRTRYAVDVEQRGLVWLIDATAEAISNRVPLDDRKALETILAVRASSADRPDELNELDVDHPLAQLLLELYRSTLFDISETPAARRAESLRESTPADSAFWDNYLRDQIRLDPRIGRYHSWAARATGVPPFDEFHWLIEQMLARAPRPGELRLLSGTTATADEREAEGKPWSPSARLAASTFNVLRRWSLALADRRVRWLVAEYAPVDHYERLLHTIVQVWSQGLDWLGKPEVVQPKLVRLLEVLWGAFVRQEHAPGYLSSLDEAERSRAIELLRTGRTPGIAAGLAYAGLRGAHPKTFFDWQPFLVPAMDWGVVEVGPGTVELIAGLTGLHPDSDAVTARLQMVAAYTDDAHWEARVAEELGFSTVLLEKQQHPDFRIELRIDDRIDLLLDPRVLSLAKEALTYRSAGSARIKSGPDVIAIGLDRLAFGRVGPRRVASTAPVHLVDLDELDQRGGALASILADEAASA